MQLSNCSWQRFWLTESFVLSDGKKLKGCIVMWNVPIKVLKSHFFTFLAVDRLTVEVSSDIQLCNWHATVHIAHLTEACINCDVKVLFIFLMKCVYIFGELQVTQLWWSCACYIYFLCTCGLYLKTWAMGAVGTSTIFCFVFAVGFDLKWQVSTLRWKNWFLWELPEASALQLMHPPYWHCGGPVDSFSAQYFAKQCVCLMPQWRTA